jgi:hypothetical protein
MSGIYELNRSLNDSFDSRQPQCDHNPRRIGISKNLGRRGDPMATHVNLDSLIPREDFQVLVMGEKVPKTPSIKINDLEPDAFFFGALRKPDFQRETAEWDAKRVVGIIRSFIKDELIPAVILWQNQELLFIIDGSHRLSALIAWVHDDYGDGPRSQEFFKYTIPEEQIKVAERTRQLVEKEFGSYKSHKEAISNPSAYGPDIVARARRFGSLSLELQWVSGNADKAEDSFIRINQQAAIISPQELELLKSRKKPNTIAARAIIRRGTGHKYWSSFAAAEQKQIEEIATELHKLLFEPALRYPIKSLDLPAGGTVYAGPALRMVFDFITICVGVPSPEDDEHGNRTIDYLTRCRSVMRLLLSDHPSSLGLHPAVYFYSWTGKQQPILFLVMAQLVVDLDRSKKLAYFTQRRNGLESFLMANRTLLNQVVRKFGTKESGTGHLLDFYRRILDMTGKGLSSSEIVTKLVDDPAYSYLQPAESPYSGVAPTKFSAQVKSGLVVRELLGTAPKCAICDGLVPAQAMSVDHKQRLQNGGTSSADNAQMTHPYCNTGYKEKMVSMGEGATVVVPKKGGAS